MMERMFRRGSQLGKYRLERRIGEGAFASVWRARDTVERRWVALKIARPAQVQVLGRRTLEQEARIASQLHHPGIVSVRNADWVDGFFVLATDLAERSLAQYVGARRSGPLALRIIRDVAGGLAHAHAHGILHRDVKPENILIFRDRHAALCDFGVSRFAKGASATYTEAGTLGYMAPEQAYGRPRPASDVFSLGLIAYELLTGKLPTWPFDWPPEGHHHFLEKVPEPVRPVLERAARFEPSRRYVDAVAFQAALEAAFRRVENGRTAHKPRRRRPPPVSSLEVQARAFQRQHGAALGMHFACHRCEGPISEAMRYCPWCGSGDNSFREITRYPLVCPHCERGVRREWTACPWCRTSLAGNGRKPRPDALAVRHCSRRGCEGQLRPFMRYCPLCRTKPRRLWSHPHLPDRCPRCRGPVSRTFWRHCPWCGRREPNAGSFGS